VCRTLGPLGRVMYEKLLKLAGDAQTVADEIRGMIAGCRDYEMLRLLKKIDAEMMDVRHNLRLVLQLYRQDEHTV